MIVVDTSALVCNLLGEEEADEMSKHLEKDDDPIISAASVLELFLVLKHKKGPKAIPIVTRLIDVAGLRIIHVSEKHISIACKAMVNYTVLSYGDLFTYALAKEQQKSLLFKGDDFTKTDISPVR